jgi:hypothetical protein
MDASPLRAITTHPLVNVTVERSVGATVCYLSSAGFRVSLRAAHYPLPPQTRVCTEARAIREQ